jgi:hypothetical protein
MNAKFKKNNTNLAIKRLSWDLNLNAELDGKIAAGLCKTSTKTNISACILLLKPSSNKETASLI